MDFKGGIPPEHRTLVAVPTMLTSAAGVERLLDGIEVRYLANRDSCLHFALLTDFVDAAAETLPGDAELVRLAREGIERLNDKYADVRADIFHLFHRARSWNAGEGVWMTAAYALLSRLSPVAAELTAAAGSEPELGWWASAYERSCKDHQADLLHLVAWLESPAFSDGSEAVGSDEQSERLRRLGETLERLDAAATLRDVAEVRLATMPLIEAALPEAPAEVQDRLV